MQPRWHTRALLVPVLILGAGCSSSEGGGVSGASPLLAAYYGYDDCLGIADANGDGTNADEATVAGCRVVTTAAGTAVTSAPTPLALALICAGQAGPESLTAQDGMPVVFERPIVAGTLDASDFRVTLSDGTTRAPVCATTAPANEGNEDRTALLVGDFGSRQPKPGESALGPWPVALEVVGSVELDGTDPARGTALEALGARYTGMFLDYRLGPGILLAELAPFTTAGEGTLGKGLPNDCRTSFPDTTHVIRVTWSGGVSIDGVRAISSNRTAIFDIRAEDDQGRLVSVGDAALGDEIRFLGLADLGQGVGTSPDDDVVDGDNVVDLCLELAAGADPARVRTVATACNTVESAVYDPAGDAPCVPTAIDVGLAG